MSVKLAETLIWWNLPLLCPDGKLLNPSCRMYWSVCRHMVLFCRILVPLLIKASLTSHLWSVNSAQGLERTPLTD